MNEMLSANIWRAAKNKFYWLYTIVGGTMVPIALAVFYIVRKNDNKAAEFYQTVNSMLLFYFFMHSFYIIFGILHPYINSKCVNATVARGISRTGLFFGLLIEEMIHLAFWGLASIIGVGIGALLVGVRAFQTIHMLSVYFAYFPILIFCMLVVNLIMLLTDNAIIGSFVFCIVSIGPIELFFKTVPALSQIKLTYFMPITVVDKFWSSLLVYHYFDGLMLIFGIIYFLLFSVISLHFFKKKELNF